jgi:hypothetical protein
VNISDAIRDDRGSAVIVALMAMALMAFVGMALVLTTSTETSIASAFRDTSRAAYAADAALEQALGDVSATLAWNALLDGTLRSPRVDGPPSGTRRLADGSTVDLDEVLNLANCDKLTRCTAAEMAAVRASRPWGPNNPRWQLYAYGPSADGASDADRSGLYAVVLVADDPAETDGDPLRDGSASGNPGAGTIVLRAQAFGPRGLRRAVEMTVVRPRPSSATTALGDSRNQHATSSSVQTAGGELAVDRLEIDPGGGS